MPGEKGIGIKSSGNGALVPGCLWLQEKFSSSSSKAGLTEHRAKPETIRSWHFPWICTIHLWGSLGLWLERPSGLGNEFSGSCWEQATVPGGTWEGGVGIRVKACQKWLHFVRNVSYLVPFTEEKKTSVPEPNLFLRVIHLCSAAPCKSLLH